MLSGTILLLAGISAASVASQTVGVGRPNEPLHIRLGANTVRAVDRWRTRLNKDEPRSAAQPSLQPRAVAEYLTDASDSAYSIAVAIGWWFSVQVDTGSSRLWVETQGCSRCNGPNHFSSQSSSTYSTSSLTETLTYGLGQANGTISFDSVQIEGLTSSNQAFSAVYSVDKDMSPIFSYGIDGIIGLSYNDGKGVDSKDQSVIQGLISQGVLSQPVFSVWLNGSTDGSVDAFGGELVLGGYDSRHYTGSITWLPLQPYISDGQQYFDYWSHRLDQVTIQSNATSISNAVAILDTGTSLIVVPQSDFDSIIVPSLGIPLTYDPTSRLYLLSCNSAFGLAPIQIVIYGTSFSVPPQQYIQYDPANNVCILGFSGSSDLKGQWILGDVFLRTYYSIYDYQNQRSGLALSAGGSLPPQPAFLTKRKASQRRIVH
ncbi:aspartic peptidase domain-containing protein [Polychytrium aggregatum]|uniref:aspartic peptidase domain-containing protein n=1 Tax=Polychytrium aggregatum TaxID=110093 RepID=UPI0022FE2104|nr:aspartic peptidase domain-containing protein [Polychytrium aggregatum]KAI9197189.1 aspartic peptidase domain-containing protein [Polychytrium aggregatum]